MKRSEVKEEYRWRLEDIFLSLAEWERQLQLLNRDIVGILRFKGRLAEKEQLLACLKSADDLGQRIEKLYAYAMLKKDENLADTKAGELKSKIQTLLVQYNSSAAFITPEL